MKRKICIECKVVKKIIEYQPRKDSPDGYRNTCRECKLAYHKKYQVENKVRLNAQCRESRMNNLEEKKIKDKEYHQRTYGDRKEIIKEQQREYYKKNPKVKKDYYKKNREKINKYARDFTRIKLQDPKYRENVKLVNKKWNEINKDKIRHQKKIYSRNKRKIDVNFRLADNLRKGVKHALKRFRLKNTLSFIERLGCSIDFLHSYLENQFEAGMNWDNYGNRKGNWSLDHIIPLSLFDLTNPAHYRKACHYTNLQPLWHADNLLKNNSLTPKAIELLGDLKL